MPAIWASNTVTGQGVGMTIASGDNQSVYCQGFASVPNDYFAEFAPLRVTVTDGVSNQQSSKQVSWTVGAGNLSIATYLVNTADDTMISPADYANQDNVGFHWTSTSGADGIAALTVVMSGIPIPGPAQGEGLWCTVTATSGSATVTFRLTVAGIMG